VQECNGKKSTKKMTCRKSNGKKKKKKMQQEKRAEESQKILNRFEENFRLQQHGPFRPALLR
jgi:hypothetical protein